MHDGLHILKVDAGQKIIYASHYRQDNNNNATLLYSWKIYGGIFIHLMSLLVYGDL